MTKGRKSRPPSATHPALPTCTSRTSIACMPTSSGGSATVHQAEDLTADVFREALAGIRKFEWRGLPFAAWLMGIASRVVADYWKTSGRETGNPTKEAEATVPADAEDSTLLFQLVDRLPEAQFRVIHMRFVEQKSIREIAQELGRSEGAVKQLQLRAIESLRAQMEGAHG